MAEDSRKWHFVEGYEYVNEDGTKVEVNKHARRMPCKRKHDTAIESTTTQGSKRLVAKKGKSTTTQGTKRSVAKKGKGRK